MAHDKKTEKSLISLREEETLKFWQENKTFEKSLAKDSPQGDFVFYDGPPFATGSPHYGHILPGTIKDVIPRFKTMQGYHVPRRWGWDTHGLPIENLVEKELKLNSKKDIEEFGIEKFTEAARATVLRYEDEWKKIIPRTGRWVDMDHPYITMDPSYTESIWWSFKTLYEKDLISRGFKVMYICPRCETSLSNFEVAQGYKDITDISVYVKFELVDEPGTSILVWTTTPWTLPGNVALAINPDTTYVKIEIKGEKYILAKERLAVIKEEFTELEEFPGTILVGMSYKPVFEYYQKAEPTNKENGWKIYAADFVTTTDGTGVVHIAPAFGEDDYQLSLKKKLPFIQHVGIDGRFKKEVTDFAGEHVKPKDDPSTSSGQGHQKTDIEIIKYLAKQGTLFAKEKIVHSYPHCWRCDTPLLNFATSSWFVKVTELKDKLLEENKKVQWIPQEIGENRFGKWLEGARDWAISRSRYWGAPIPVWICKECERMHIVGSIAELTALGGTTPKNKTGELDLHRPYIDEVTLRCTCGGEMKRVLDVFDTWYESGSMPYASKAKFPADFIAEGLDQTRGWFYSLLVLSTGLFGQSPYNRVVVNGLLLAEDGRKMSKRLQNYPEMQYVFDTYGADALRYFLMSSPAVHAGEFSFSEKGLDEVVKKLIMRLNNVYTFYETYRKEEKAFDFSKLTNVLDLWILARLTEVIEKVTASLEKYELDRAAWPFMDFIDDLSTWYLRRSRDRFKGENEQDKQAALHTTKFVLFELSKLIAPFMPFLAEDIYQKVKPSESKESVHLEDWPDFVLKNEVLLKDMAEVRKSVSLALEARAKINQKIRQPLQILKIKSETLKGKSGLLDLIKDEVNVKEVLIETTIAGDVELDATITPELKREGQARELIRSIQELRKKEKLNPHDVVTLIVETTDEVKELVEKFKTEIMKTAQLKDILFEKTNGEKIHIDELWLTMSITQKDS
ncbi:isoleucine--tRNA ligase [Candidatus Parcubacteria bacterium]|nr:isoleucine--tRNA ligase [Candidatus Parcubacteria bacterium]